MQKVPKNMLRRNDVIWWMKRLEQVDHYIEPETALTIANWWDDEQGPLILEGPPGGGKTSLAKKIAQLMGASFYRLQCYKSIGKTEALYDWDKNVQGVLVQEAAKKDLLDNDINKIIYQQKAMVLGVLAQSLLDKENENNLFEYEYKDENNNIVQSKELIEDRHVIVLIDELDKIPSEEAFEGLLLEFLEERAITVAELNSRISSAPGVHLHIVITSNAGSGGLKESLSHPILRRGRYIYLPEPDPGRQFSILKQCAPSLKPSLIRDIIAFTYWAKKLVRFEKPIALSEVIMWARALEMCEVKELNKAVVQATVSELAKRDRDKNVLLDSTDRLLRKIQKLYYQNDTNISNLSTNVLQFPKQNPQNPQGSQNPEISVKEKAIKQTDNSSLAIGTRKLVKIR